MRYAFATALIDFQIDSMLKSPVAIKNGLFVTNNPGHVARFLQTSHIVTIGSLEAKPLTGGSVVLYRVDDLPDISQASVEVINFLREVQAFLTAAWLKKDNSANCELAFSFGQETPHVHSNSLALQYTDHSGGRKSIKVDEGLLAEICKLHATSFQGVTQQNFPAHTVFRKSIARLDRGMKFLQQARSSDDLGQKVANYCSFFEALLSTSASELSHQLSERIAFLLSDDPNKRLGFFKDVKKAYGVRSKIVHGDILTAGVIASLVDVARTCDEFARSLVLKIVQEPHLDALFNTGSNELLDAYMLNLIFGVKESPSSQLSS
ncbi:hypothetical protein V9L20_09430 [Variovorax sp. CCNWLW225]|uniref:hypothetical protein n=1 Tax=Variovorax sp. CCNWLW225 TaxID=3127462 RepID=UPI0030770861